jgi:hypothetical protein
MNKTTYTSPTSGTTYDIQKYISWYGNWDTDGNYTKVNVTYWHIIKDGTMLNFCFSEKEIPTTVDYCENPPRDISSWCD